MTAPYGSAPIAPRSRAETRCAGTLVRIDECDGDGVTVIPPSGLEELAGVSQWTRLCELDVARPSSVSCDVLMLVVSTITKY
jgi:hypothetical protein